MLWIQNSQATAGGGGFNSLYTAIQNTVGTTNLSICLDAGSSASYSSGQQWTDLTGNGVNFNRGIDSNSSTDDPTFNGVAGALTSSEYWTFDGGDLFSLVGGVPNSINNIHKDNAKYTLLFIVYFVGFTSPASAVSLCGDLNSSLAGNGFLFNIGTTSSTGTLGLFVPGSLNKRSTIALSSGVWNIFGVSVDEGAASGIWWKNKTQEVFTSTYTSPTTSNASGTFVIGGGNSQLSSQVMDANQRLAGFALFDTNLAKIDLDAIYDGIKSRYGLT